MLQGKIIKKARKSIITSHFLENAVISFSVLRAKNPDCVSSRDFYFLPLHYSLFTRPHIRKAIIQYQINFSLFYQSEILDKFRIATSPLLCYTKPKAVMLWSIFNCASHLCFYYDHQKHFCKHLCFNNFFRIQ